MYSITQKNNAAEPSSTSNQMRELTKEENRLVAGGWTFDLYIGTDPTGTGGFINSVPGGYGGQVVYGGTITVNGSVSEANKNALAVMAAAPKSGWSTLWGSIVAWFNTYSYGYSYSGSGGSG